MRRTVWLLLPALLSCSPGGTTGQNPGETGQNPSPEGKTLPGGSNEEVFQSLAAKSKAPADEVPLDLDDEACQELAEVRTDPGNLPQLQVSNEKGESVNLPLTHTAVKASLSGYVAEVEVIQTYENPFSSPIEATYIFPLPENSAVFDMQIKIGERLIASEIKKREEARQIYEEAKREGYTAALLEQQRPNVFTQSVANIEPQRPIEVIIRYVQDLSYDAGQYEFVFPMVVGPRFFPPKEGASGQGDSLIQATEEASYINPPILGAGMRSGHDISIEVNVTGGFPIGDFKVPTHKVTSSRGQDGSLSVKLDPSDSIPNRDFVLRYRVDGTEPQATFLTHKGEKGGFFSLVVHPPALNLEELVGNREIIFVVDISGSMGGQPIEMCKDAMREALLRLRPVDTFNIITFAGATEEAFKKPQPANSGNITLASRFIDRMMAGGGTYMANAIDKALSPEVEPGRNRYVFFMTDGYVGNEGEIIARTAQFVSALEAKQQKAKVFGFGVGAAPNRFLLDGLSREGKGTTVYVSTREDPVRAVNAFYRYIDHSILEDVSIDWGGLSVSEVYPQELPDLFASRPMILHGRYKGKGEATITVRGKANGVEQKLPIKVSLPEEEPENQVLATLWARARITDLSRGLWGGEDSHLIEEITKLGIDYRIVTQYTSFVAVDRSRKVSDGNIPTVQQAVEAPEGAELFSGGKRVRAPMKIAPSPSTASPMADGLAKKPKPVEGAAEAPAPEEAKDNSVGTENSITSKASVVAGTPILKGSGLSREVIQRIIKRVLPAIQACYEREANISPTLSGKLNVRFIIEADGSVSSVKGSGISSAVDSCAIQEIEKLSFPKPEGGGTVEVIYPLTFKPVGR